MLPSSHNEGVSIADPAIVPSIIVRRTPQINMPISLSSDVLTSAFLVSGLSRARPDTPDHMGLSLKTSDTHRTPMGPSSNPAPDNGEIPEFSKAAMASPDVFVRCGMSGWKPHRRGSKFVTRIMLQENAVVGRNVSMG